MTRKCPAKMKLRMRAIGLRVLRQKRQQLTNIFSNGQKLNKSR
jgi:hypothetical protein